MREVLVAGIGSPPFGKHPGPAIPSLKGRAPYAIAMVDLDAGIRVTGRPRCDLDGVRLGAAVAAVAHENGAYLFEETRA